MLKKILGLLFAFAFVIISCTVKEPPEFIGVKNIKVLESTKTYITIKGDALFRNLNDIGGNLKADGIKVFVNGNEMATVTSDSFDVPAKEEFTIPLKVNIPTDSIFSNKNIGGLIGSLFSKKIEVNYKGKILYKVFGFSHSYDVNETEKIKIKL
ncbi:LEA type 2 family protein [Lutibacter citreus]|uniref:LEA type 2 family protein n=1 Tax=Lutibacter citreus TaxID=2138210 RepID=UPI000DBE2B0F|nr:LEA type 2 family protein [Lutibacter citreus]